MSDHVYPPWEPPFAGTETEHVLGSLDRLRATFRWKADDLDTDQIHTPLPPTRLTVAGLLKHLAVQEDYATAVKIAGRPMPSVWDDNGWDSDDDWEFSSAASDSPESLYALYDGAVARSRAAFAAYLADGGLDRQVHMTQVAGEPVSVRRVVYDMVEEYGRHTGQADLLREAVDGVTGA